MGKFETSEDHAGRWHRPVCVPIGKEDVFASALEMLEDLPRWSVQSVDKEGLSATCEGKKHDKRLADEQALRFPKGSKLWKDTGFQGYEPAGVTTLQPKKKPKGGKLSPEEKEANRRVSKVRVRVEHSIAGVKVFRSVRDIYRNFKAGFEDTLIETACGLHNLRSDFPIEAWLKAA